MPRVFHLISGTAVGGTELVLRHTLPAFDQRRFEHHAGCLRPPGPLSAELADDGFPVFSANLSGGRTLPGAAARLVRHLRRLRPDILHGHLTHANLACRLLAPLAGRPVVVNSYRNVSFPFGRALYLANRVTAPLADAVVVSSAAIKAYYRSITGYRDDRIFIIPNAAGEEFFGAPWTPAQKGEYRRQLGVPERAYLIGAVGNFRPEKAYDVLLAAFAQVAARQPAVFLLLAGDGELRPACERQARALGVADRVKFLGRRREVAEIISALDLFVQASRHEGFGVTVAEAMARELPVVATRAGGLPEVVADQVTGVLAPVDNPTALAEAILALSHDPERAGAMGRAGRRRAAEKFRVDRVARQLEDLYSRLLAGRATGRSHG